MTDQFVLPLEDGGTRVWSSSTGTQYNVLREPYPANCTKPWVEPDKPLALRGMKSNDKYVLCVGGPLHRVKLRRQHKIGKRKIDLVGTKPFTVPPYRGRYYYNKEEDRFQWNSS